MFFYDTCSLLNNYSIIFKNISSSPFVVSNITLMELEEIKNSSRKDDNIKFKAKKVSQLLNFYYGKYTIVNYEREWDETYLKTIPFLLDNNDSRIVTSAYVYSERHPDICFVTDDVNCNNLAKCLGLTTNSLTTKEDAEYTGYKIITCYNENELAEVYNKVYSGEHFDLLPNQYLIIRQDDKDIDCYVLRDNKLIQVQFNTFKSKMLGEIKPIDLYQKLAVDSLQHNTLTMLRGAAGTGKSYLGLGFLFDRLEAGVIDKIIIFCNTVATAGSAKLGYYPGSRTEKLLDSQIGNFLVSKLGDRVAVERLIAEGELILLPMSDIRGFDTTGMRAGIYITEAQNLNIDLIKLALQRIGDDGICVLDGDSDTQVDLGIYSGVNNGMRRVSKVFKGQEFYGEVTLPICHRSKIAQIAERL
jgi:predicted ribonuclease YlaK